MKSDKSDTNQAQKDLDHRIAASKEEFLQKLDEFFGNVTRAASISGINRDTPYDWSHRDPEFAERFKKIIKLARKKRADIAENKLFEAVLKGNMAVIVFTLKKYNPEEFGDIGLDKRPEPVMHKLSPELQRFVDKLRQEGHTFRSDRSNGEYV